MQLNDLKMPLVVIVGPTAVGKTEISLQLAHRFNGEIISADSRLFYRGMDIGTAKPTLEERAYIPHHLIDVTTPDQPWSLALFQRVARETIKDIYQRNKLPFLVGGTGQYVQAVIEAWEIPARAPDETMRHLLTSIGTRLGAVEFHRKLSMIDPDAAALIEPNNLRRTVRAFEVILMTGRKFSVQRSKGTIPYRICKIGLTRPRSELYQRIDQRIDKMIADGLFDEVKDLLEQGFPTGSPAFSAIGYREMILVIQKEIDLAEAVLLMRRYTRQFVRRQANWFKRTDSSIRWFDLSQSGVGEIEEYLNDLF
jgi:tRNA dimethylallyltransferase